MSAAFQDVVGFVIMIGIGGVALLPLGLWLAVETVDDSRAPWIRGIAALRGEWPSLRSVIWYRRAFVVALGCWTCGIFVGVASALLTAF